MRAKEKSQAYIGAMLERDNNKYNAIFENFIFFRFLLKFLLSDFSIILEMCRK